MKKMLIAFLMLPLAQTGAFAQAAGDAAAGRCASGRGQAGINDRPAVFSAK
jgi:hypothetical protein